MFRNQPTNRFVLLLALYTLFDLNVARADQGRPNIVFILADDFGVGDIQSNYPENKIATPHLDRFVRQGMNITDAHSPSAD